MDEYVVIDRNAYITHKGDRYLKLVKDEDSGVRAIIKLRNKNAKSIKNWKIMWDDIKDKDYFTNQIQIMETADYAVVTFDEYEALEREYFIGDNTVQEITEEEYEYALNILPPMFFCIADDISFFMVREAISAYYYDMYARDRTTGKCYYKVADSFDTNTWISRDMLTA